MTAVQLGAFTAIFAVAVGVVFVILNRQTKIGPGLEPDAQQRPVGVRTWGSYTVPEPDAQPDVQQRLASLERRCLILTRALVAVGILAAVLPFALVRLGGFFGVTVWADKIQVQETIVVGNGRQDYEHPETVISNEGVQVVIVKPKAKKDVK